MSIYTFSPSLSSESDLYKTPDGNLIAVPRGNKQQYYFGQSQPQQQIQTKYNPYTKQYETQVVQNSGTYLYSDYDPLNEDKQSRYEMTKDILYLFLDKWLFDENMANLLKYLKVVNGVVSLVSNEAEMIDNKIKDDKISDVEMKADFIEDNLLGKKEMMKILKGVTEEYNYKWYSLLQHKKTIFKEVKKYLRRKMIRKMNGK